MRRRIIEDTSDVARKLCDGGVVYVRRCGLVWGVMDVQLAIAEGSRCTSRSSTVLM